jgi:uncharacterized protein (DUF2062 family)/SAM-dependent methyltransferase
MNAVRRRLHEFLRQLAQEHTAPSRLALGVFVGVVVGVSPLFGLHLPICIALAWLLGLNQIVVYGAANISLPPTVPFIAFASAQVGERVLHGRWLPVHLADITWRNAPELAKSFFLDWLLGGAIVGAALGVIAGAIVYVAVRARRARAQAQAQAISGDPLAQIIAGASARYRELKRKYRYYAHFKYRLDPCYRAISAHLPPDTFTVDLGTGLGMLPVFLAVLGDGRRALGVEWDAEKVRAGQAAAEGLATVELVEGDVRAFAIPSCDAITLVDVLHYYDAEAQRALLERCRAALRPGGRLLVREGDRERSGGARWTRFIEAAVTRLGWNRGPGVRFRPVGELRADLESLGFRVRVDEVAGRLHPGNVLLVCERI